MKPPPVEAPCCANPCQPIFSAGAAAASGAAAAAAACCCGSMPCDKPPNALPVAAPDAWYACPSFWKSKFGSVKKRKAVSMPCAPKPAPVAAPCCANGIQPPRGLAPSATGAASADFSAGAAAAAGVVVGAAGVPPDSVLKLLPVVWLSAPNLLAVAAPSPLPLPHSVAVSAPAPA